MSKRCLKISEVISRKLSELIHKNLSEELGIIGVNFVDISPDFRQAKVYVSGVDVAISKEKLSILQSCAHEFQKELGKILSTKFTPKIEFKLDTKQKNINHIEEILEKINNES